MQSNTGENLQEDDQQSTCEIPCSLPDKRPCRDPLKGDEPPPHSCNVGLVGNRVIVGTSWSRTGPVRKEASRLPCLEEPFSVEQVQTCWASSLLGRGWTCLWHWKNIWRNNFWALIWTWENGQGVPCRVDAAFASPSSHFLNFPSPLFCSSPTPIYFSNLCFLLLLLSSFWCLSLSLWFLLLSLFLKNFMKAVFPFISKCVDIQ